MKSHLGHLIAVDSKKKNMEKTDRSPNLDFLKQSARTTHPERHQLMNAWLVLKLVKDMFIIYFHVFV